MTVATYDPNAAIDPAIDPTIPIVSVTDAAQAHFKRILNNSDNVAVRLSTKVSGCSGYAYVLEPVATAKEGDIEIVLNGDITLLVAKGSQELVKDTKIDYVQQGINGEIRFNNPNVVNECGCGESFNVG